MTSVLEVVPRGDGVLEEPGGLKEAVPSQAEKEAKRRKVQVRPEPERVEGKISEQQDGAEKEQEQVEMDVRQDGM